MCLELMRMENMTNKVISDPYFPDEYFIEQSRWSSRIVLTGARMLGEMYPAFFGLKLFFPDHGSPSWLYTNILKKNKFQFSGDKKKGYWFLPKNKFPTQRERVERWDKCYKELKDQRDELREEKRKIEQTPSSMHKKVDALGRVTYEPLRAQGETGEKRTRRNNQGK